MSTVDEPIKPCPWCGNETPRLVNQGAHLGYVQCIGGCGASGPLADKQADDRISPVGEWNALSDAAALARAVEKIEAMMRAPGETDERQLLCDAVGDRIFADIGIVPDGVVLSKVQQRARAATLAAALVALAEQVTE